MRILKFIINISNYKKNFKNGEYFIINNMNTIIY